MPSSEIRLRLEASQVKSENAQLARRFDQTRAATQRLTRQYDQLLSAQARALAAQRNYGGALASANQRVASAERGTVQYYRAVTQEASIRKQATRAAQAHTQAIGGETRALATQRSVLQGLTGELKGMVLAGGGLAALRLGFDFARQGAQIEAVRQAFNSLAQSSGQDGGRLLANIRATSRGTIGEFDAMRSANIAMLGQIEGFAQALPELAGIARAAGLATGRDITESYSRLVEGIAKAEPEILDEMGIRVNLTRLYDEAADKLHKNADALTLNEKAQALLNEVLRQGGDLVENTGLQAETAADRFATMETGVQNLTTLLETGLANAIMGVSDAWRDFFAAIGISETGLRPIERLFSAGDQVQGFHQQILAGANSWQDYSDKVAQVNDQLPWYVSSIQALTPEQFALAQALKDTGAPIEQVMQQMAAASDFADGLSLAITQVGGAGTEQGQVLSELAGMLLTVAGTGAEAQEQVTVLAEQFLNGEISADQLRAAVLTLRQGIQEHNFEAERAAGLSQQMGAAWEDAVPQADKLARAADDLATAQLNAATASLAAAQALGLSHSAAAAGGTIAQQARLAQIKREIFGPSSFDREAAERRQRAGGRATGGRQHAGSGGERASEAAARKEEAVFKARIDLLEEEGNLTEKLRLLKERLAQTSDEETRLDLLKEIHQTEGKIADEQQKQVEAQARLNRLRADDAIDRDKELQELEQANRILRSSTADANMKRRARMRIAQIRAEEDERAVDIAKVAQDAGVAGGPLPALPGLPGGPGGPRFPGAPAPGTAATGQAQAGGQDLVGTLIAALGQAQFVLRVDGKDIAAPVIGVLRRGLASSETAGAVRRQ